MKSLLKVSLISVACLMVFNVQAQRILLVEKPGTFKNFKYFVGDEIILKTMPFNDKIAGSIHFITDSSIVVDFDQEIMLNEIESVLKPRWGFGLLSGFTRYAGAGYLVLDIVNNAINHEVMVDKNTLIISGSLVAFSYAIVPLHTRKLTIGDRWRIKVLNLSMDEEVTSPFLR
ncbi:MAG: hypothetical protein RQ761_02085 [Bacteroidales bacterium]|nr:hypothetical protein [Bacteroidales bacterium]